MTPDGIPDDAIEALTMIVSPGVVPPSQAEMEQLQADADASLGRAWRECEAG